MGFLDKRTDTEKEISQLHKKPKFTIEIGREAKEKTDADFNTNTEHEYKPEYIRAAKKFAEQQANSKNIAIRYVLLIIAIVAVIFVVMIVLSKYLSESNFEILLMYVFMPVVFGAFLLFGFALMFIPKIEAKKNRERCRYPVKAKILNIKRQYAGKTEDGRNTYTYTFTYQYFYLGREYFIVRKQGGGEILKVGDEIDMFINENDPEDYYIKDKIYEVFHFIMGLNLIFWTTIAIICTLLSY